MRVYLDTTEIFDLPLGFGEEGVSEVIELDLNLHGYVLYYELPVTFIGDGAKYVRDIKKQQGFCAKIEIRIETEDGLTSTGFFFITDCRFNHTDLSVEAEITDSTYGVFISEAKNLKISPLATVTRSGDTLTPVAASDVTIFTPSTGADLATDAKMFELADTVEHMVKFLSDNGLQFSQTYFGGSFNFYLTNHFCIRTGNRSTIPDTQFSFLELMEQCFKLFGIWFKIDNSTVPPTFTLVQGEGNFFEGYAGITFPNIRDLIEEFYPDRFFATVAVGDSEAIIERGTTYQLPTVPLVGFREEIYNAASDCSLDEELDLKTEWIIDHNKIESFITSTDYQEEPVLIYVDGSLNAHKGTYAVQGARRYYNEEALNYKVLERHNVNSSLFQQLGADTDSFRAAKTADTNSTVNGSLTPVDYDDDALPFGFDTGGNYNTGTYRYVIPTTGSYKFRATTEYIINSIQNAPGGFPGTGSVTILVNIIRKTSGGATISSVNVNNVVHLTPTITSIIKIGDAQFFCEATDYVEVTLSWSFLYTFLGATNDITFLGAYIDGSGNRKGCYFESIFVFNNGGTVDTSNLLDYRASALKFDGYPITASQWKSLRQNPAQGIHINNGGSDSLTWIKKIKRNRKTGEADCEMISSPLLTQL